MADGFRLAELLMAGPFDGVEMILHAGDHVIPDLDSCFTGLPYYGVSGNMDPVDSFLPQKRIVEVGSVRIGMTHGWGPVGGIEERVMDSFRDDAIDVLVYGHSHRPVCRRIDSVLLLNPGSPTDRRSSPFHSVAVLDIDGKMNINAEIIALD
jgi:putative phosphoesterase